MTLDSNTHSFEEPPPKNTKIKLFVFSDNGLKEHACTCKKNNFSYIGVLYPTLGENEENSHILLCDECGLPIDNHRLKTKVPFFLNKVFFWRPMTPITLS